MKPDLTTKAVLLTSLKHIFIYIPLAMGMGYLLFYIGYTFDTFSTLFQATGSILIFLSPLIFIPSAIKRPRIIFKYRKLGVTDYLPSFYFVKSKPDGNSFDKSLMLIGNDAFIVCSTYLDISHEIEDDFWDGVGKELLRIPYRCIKTVNYFIPDGNLDEIKKDRKVKDLLYTQTVGRMIGRSSSTIVFGAFVYIIYKSDNSEQTVVFAVGGKGSSVGLMDIIGEELPTMVSVPLEIGQIAIEFHELKDEDTEEIKIAKILVNGIIKTLQSKIQVR